MPTLPKGAVYHAAAHPDLQKTRPAFAFVPDAMIEDKTLNKEAYVNNRWASINAGANGTAVGSHLFPDLSLPASPEESKTYLKALTRFSQKHRGPASKTKLPGKGLEI